MRDQVAQLREAGIEAASLNSGSDPDERRRVARGLELATEANAWLLITGSLYLIGALRGAVGEAALIPHGTGAALGLGPTSVRGHGGSD